MYEYNTSGNVYSFDVLDDALPGTRTYSVEVQFPFVGYYEVYSGTWEPGITTEFCVDLTESIPFFGLPKGTYNARLEVEDPTGLSDTVDIIVTVVRDIAPEITNYLPEVMYYYNTTGNVYTFDVRDDALPGPRTYSVEVQFPFVGWYEIYSGTWETGITNTVNVDLTESIPFLGLPKGTYNARLEVIDPNGFSDSVEITVNVVKNMAPEIVNYASSVVFEYNTAGNEYTFEVLDDNLPGPRTYSVKVQFPIVGWQQIYSGTWEPGVVNAFYVDLTQSLPLLGLPNGIFNARLQVVDPSGLSDMVDIVVNVIKT
jgi:hypothetical protein